MCNICETVNLNYLHLKICVPNELRQVLIIYTRCDKFDLSSPSAVAKRHSVCLSNMLQRQKDVWTFLFHSILYSNNYMPYLADNSLSVVTADIIYYITKLCHRLAANVSSIKCLYDLLSVVVWDYIRSNADYFYKHCSNEQYSRKKIWKFILFHSQKTILHNFYEPHYLNGTSRWNFKEYLLPRFILNVVTREKYYWIKPNQNHRLIKEIYCTLYSMCYHSKQDEVNYPSSSSLRSS